MNPLDQLKEIPVGVKTDENEWGNMLELCPGLDVYRLPTTRFVVARCHYTVEHRRRGPAWPKAASAKYGRRGERSHKWRQEQEIDFNASSGDPIFANWEAGIHVVKAFDIPPTWKRWIMYDPGGVNPHAVDWWAMDPEPPYYRLYCYRSFYVGMKMPDRSEGKYMVAPDVIRIAYNMSIDDLGRLERIDALIVDPAARIGTAKSRHQADKVPDRSRTVYEEIMETCDMLGWQSDVVTGNNLKDTAIDDLIERIGNYPVYEEENGVFLEDPAGNPIVMLDDQGKELWVQPTLYVFRGCRWVAWEFAHYQWAEWSSDVVNESRNRPEDPVDKNDHSMTNAIRLMNWIRRDPEIHEPSNEQTPVSDAAERIRRWRKERGVR